MNNSIAALLISTPLGGIQIRGSTKTGGRVLNNLQRPLRNVRSAVFRMARMLMTWSSLGGLGVSPGVLTVLYSVLTTTS